MPDVFTLSVTLEQFTSIEDESTSPLEVVYVHVRYKGKEQTQKDKHKRINTKDVFIIYILTLIFAQNRLFTHVIYVFVCMYAYF